MLGALSRGLEAHQPDVLSHDQIRTYIMDHVDRGIWDAVSGGDMHILGGVLAITQTSRNIRAAQRAMENLEHELPPYKAHQN